jgi:hypothetical protein
MDPLIVVPLVSAIISAATGYFAARRRRRQEASLPSITIHRPDGEELVIDSFADTADQRKELEAALGDAKAQGAEPPEQPAEGA